jgi:hypothetical protein
MYCQLSYSAAEMTDGGTKKQLFISTKETKAVNFCGTTLIAAQCSHSVPIK